MEVVGPLVRAVPAAVRVDRACSPATDADADVGVGLGLGVAAGVAVGVGKSSAAGPRAGRRSIRCCG